MSLTVPMTRPCYRSRARYRRALRHLELLEPRTLLSATTNVYHVSGVMTEVEAYDSAGRLWVLNENTTTLDMISPGSNDSPPGSVMTSIPLDDAFQDVSPSYLAMVPGTGALAGHMYISDNAGIDDVNLGTSSVTHYDLSASPFKMTFTPAGNVWFIGLDGNIGRWTPGSLTADSHAIVGAGTTQAVDITAASNQSGDDTVWVGMTFTDTGQSPVVVTNDLDLLSFNANASTFSNDAIYTVQSQSGDSLDDLLANSSNGITSVSGDGSGGVWFNLQASTTSGVSDQAIDRLVHAHFVGMTLQQDAFVLNDGSTGVTGGLGSPAQISHVAVDSSGRVWFDEIEGNNVGFYDTNSSSFTFIAYPMSPTDPVTFVHDFVTGLAVSPTAPEATFINDEGQFLTITASTSPAPGTIPVNEATIDNDLDAAITAAENSNTPAEFQAETASDATTFFEHLASKTATSDITITLYGSNTNAFLESNVTVPAHITLVINGAMFQGGSPALIVSGGNVVVRNSTLTNSTEAPTIRIIGGKLTLRDSTVQNNQQNQALIEVDGAGEIDAGSADDAGNNIFRASEGGVLLDNETGQPLRLPDTGNSYLFDGQEHADSLRLVGVLWVDLNNDGNVDFGELGLAGYQITLTGTDDLGTVNEVVNTVTDGAYCFTDLRPGTYTISLATVPAGYALGNNNGTISGITLTADQEGMNYNFTLRPLPGTQVARGQTAGIGFWQNKNGQALIKSLNGGPTSHLLANWLAQTLPNIFGVNAGSHDLTGKTNADVAALFQQLFGLKGPKLDAQLMATALSSYVTSSTLAGTTATSYGFAVSTYGLGNSTYDVGANWSAFVAPGVTTRPASTTMTVLDILQAADLWAVDGVLYYQQDTLRTLALNVFAAINKVGGI